MTTDDLGLADELLPCPFCGSAADRGDGGSIMCSNAECPAVCGVPAHGYRQDYNAISVWNTRAALRSPRAVPANGAGREALEKVQKICERPVNLSDREQLLAICKAALASSPVVGPPALPRPHGKTGDARS